MPKEDRGALEVLSVTTLAAFLSGLDARITVIGLPVIAAALGADLEQALWFTQAYMLGSTAAQLVIGRLADLYGRVRLFTLGFGIFSFAMLFCGFARTSWMLILFRFIQGVGAALIMNLSLTIIADNAPRNRLGTWLGVNQVAFRVGALVGLTLGGLIVDKLGWRWIYWLFVPVGFAAIPWSSWRIKESYRPPQSVHIDWLGFFFFTSSITFILLGLTAAAYGLSLRLLSEVFIALGLALLVVFALCELREKEPALDLRLFKVWSFAGGITAQLFYSIAFGATSILAVIYFTSVKALSSSEAGLLLIPFEVSFLVAGLLGGPLSDRLGYAPLTVGGCLVSSGGLALLAALTPSSPLVAALVPLILIGVGTGLFTAPNTSSILGSVPPERRGVASSVRAVAFNVGFTLSLNVAVLAMTQVIPYELVTQMVISESGSSPNHPEEVGRLATAVSSSYKIQALIMLIAALFSLARLKPSSKAKTVELTLSE